MLSSWAHGRHEVIGAELPGFVFTYSHWWQLSKMMQMHLSREIQGCLFIKSRVKMKGQRELKWPVQRGGFKVKAKSSALYGDRSKIMSTEHSPWERITESSISLPYCCFWLRLTCARMKCLRFLWRQEPNWNRKHSPTLASSRVCVWKAEIKIHSGVACSLFLLCFVYPLLREHLFPSFVKGCCCHFCSFLMPAKSFEVSAVISLNGRVKSNNCRTSAVQSQGLI